MAGMPFAGLVCIGPLPRWMEFQDIPRMGVADWIRSALFRNNLPKYGNDPDDDGRCQCFGEPRLSGMWGFGLGYLALMVLLEDVPPCPLQ